MSSDHAVVEEVIRAEKEWLRAHIECDTTALDRMMADEYVQIGWVGEVRGKEEVLASFRTSDRHWEYAESDQLDVRVYGETAVVIGRWRAKGINAGRRFNYPARFVSVWVHRDDRWQMVSDQSTPIS